MTKNFSNNEYYAFTTTLIAFALPRASTALPVITRFPRSELLDMVCEVMLNWTVPLVVFTSQKTQHYSWASEDAGLLVCSDDASVQPTRKCTRGQKVPINSRNEMNSTLP